MGMSDRGRAFSLWLPPLAMMALIFALSSIPSGDVNSILQGPLRKLSHFAEFALLAALWWRALRSRLRPGAALAAAFAATAAYAVADEVHQGFVEGRHASALDVAIDAAGAATALLLIARRRVPSRA
jgi:VanZ family protein